LSFGEKIILLLKESPFGISGLVLVFTCSNYGKLNAVLCCGGFALIFSIIIPKEYMFVLLASLLGGVMDESILYSIGFIFLTGSLIAIINRLTAGIFRDIGGKPGTIAFFANCISLLIVYLIGLSEIYKYDVINSVYNSIYLKKLDAFIYAFAPCFSMVAALCLHFISEAKGVNVNRVSIYGLVTLFGSLILSTFTTTYFELNGGKIVTYGAYFTNYWHIGCLLGLSIRDRYKHHFIKGYYFYHYMFAGYISGWIGIGLSAVIYVGGKHGFAAFMANLIYMWFVHFIFVVFKIPESEADIVELESIHKMQEHENKLITDDVNVNVKNVDVGVKGNINSFSDKKLIKNNLSYQIPHKVDDMNEIIISKNERRNSH
jgi:hypothetical protein